jgi:hypothetical protein
VDHHIKVSTVHGGILSFQVSQTDQENRHWAFWPHLTICTDQGSPEMCAMNFAQQVLRCSVDEICDFGHGPHRDLGRNLRRCGLWNHVLLNMAEWSIPHGPWSEDVRSKEVQGCYNALFARYERPEDSPLFMSLVPSLLHEQGLAELAGDGTAPQTPQKMWHLCRRLNPFALKGCQTNLNRFLRYLAKGSAEAELHSIRRLGYLSCCLEQDYAGSSKLTKLLRRGSSKPEGAPDGSTSLGWPDAMGRCEPVRRRHHVASGLPGPAKEA